MLSTLGAIIIMGSTCWVVLTRQKDKEEVKQKSRALSFSSSTAGGEFTRDDFDTDDEIVIANGNGPQRPTQSGGQARYTAVNDEEVAGMEAGLLTNGPATTVLPAEGLSKSAAASK